MSTTFTPTRTRITTNRYQMMVATGVLTKYDRIELIEGDMLDMAPMGTQPQPDLMLLKRRADFYSGKTPEATDVLLLIEVSDSSLSFDQGVMLNLYARYRVAEYWVVDVEARRVVTYLEPTPMGYGRTLEFAAADTVAPHAFPQLRIAVGEIFGGAA